MKPTEKLFVTLNVLGSCMAFHLDKYTFSVFFGLMTFVYLFEYLIQAIEPKLEKEE